MTHRALIGLLLALALAAGCQPPTSVERSSTARPPATPTTTKRPIVQPSPCCTTLPGFSETFDGEGIHLIAIDVPAGAYRYEWTAVGECDYDVRLGKRTVGQDAPTWLVEIAMPAGRGSGAGEFTLPETAGILQLSGTGCEWTFALEAT